MKDLLKKITSASIAFVLLVTLTNISLVEASFTPVQGITYPVASTILPSDNTITISSFNNSNGTPFVMSNFGSKGYGTLDPLNNSRIESISFTGITKNASTVTLTGVSRGLDFVFPYTASSTLQRTHLVGASFILSNTSAFYNEFLFANNTGTSTALMIFSSTTPPRYDGQPTFTLGTQLVDKTYADGLSFNGVATSSETNFGGVWLSTALQQASSTNGAPNSPYVLQSKNATSSPVTGCNSTSNPGALCTVIARNDGKISPNFIATSSSDRYNWGGVTMFNASTTFNATTTIASLDATSTALIINNVPYGFPRTQGTNGTLLQNNGSGNLTWGTPLQYSAVSLTSTSTAGFSTTTLISIPAGVLTASSTITVRGGLNCTNSSAGCIFYLRDGTGRNFSTFTITHGTSNSQVILPGTFSFQVLPNNSVSSQNTIYQYTNLQLTLNGGGSTATLDTSSTANGDSQSSINLANALTLNLVMRGQSDTATLNDMSVIVNP